jgi:hypothetical protein
LPSEEKMLADIKREQVWLEKRYYSSSRHTIQIDQTVYPAQLAAEIEAGRKRALENVSQQFRKGA